jgi:hypothetical protein
VDKYAVECRSGSSYRLAEMEVVEMFRRLTTGKCLKGGESDPKEVEACGEKDEVDGSTSW